MSSHSCVLDADLMDALLGGQLDEAGEQQLTEHLDGCADCRQRLEQYSAAPTEWKETSQLLVEQPFDADSQVLQRTRDDFEETDSPAPSIQHVVQSLGPTDDPNMLGRMGSYEISGVVGSGAMGVVLKALDPSLDRTVAIKVLAPHLASSGAARRRFAREAKAAAAVLHPNVIAIHGVADGDDSTALPFLVMPYVRGSSLQSRIDREGPMTVTETLRVAAQIVDGLAAAHAQGLVHRDIKPANILLEEGIERVSITDFGLARAVDDATLTRSGVIAGTPQYMSPEQARGEPIDARSDLFSLGSVMYTMCTGRPPFRAETCYGILRRITDEPPRPIREINPETPTWLCRLIEKLHAKSAEDRYQSASSVAAVLQQCLAHVQTPDARLPRELRNTVPASSTLVSFGFVFSVAAIISLLAVLGQNDLRPPETAPPTNRLTPSEMARQTPASDEATDSSVDSTEPLTPARETQPPPVTDRASIDPSDAWIDESEPSIEAVQSLIDAIDLETTRPFDRGDVRPGRGR